MKNLKYLTLLFFITGITPQIVAQTQMRRLPNSINHPSINTFAPYISADANALVFISDNAEDNALTPFFTWRDNADWREPQVFPKSIYTRLNFTYGFALSADGKRLFYTTLKTPSVGGFDIWISDWKGNTWSEPSNLGAPVNTKGHEASPSITPDGNTMYFMRCGSMDQSKANNCKIFRTTKKQNGQWNEAEELPDYINTGNSQSPRIMADGEMLLFSSDKMAGNKGGMDLYSTRFENGSWSNPVPWSFINTEKDDQYVSVAALGRYIIKDAMGQRKNELTEYLIPDALRPKGVMKIDGKVSNASALPGAAYISIFDLTKNKRVYSGRPYADGSFIAYIMEGSQYEIAIEPEQDNLKYFSKKLDLTTERIPQVEKVTAEIKPIMAGDEFALEMITFKPYSSQIEASSASSADFKRFMRLIKGNPTAKFEIQVMLNGYLQDSVQSNPDLTEIIYDSLTATYDDIDSLGQLYRRDTTIVRATYHNDRTWQQAEAIISFFASQGANPDNFTTFGNAIPATLPENRKLTIKAVVKAAK